MLLNLQHFPLLLHLLLPPSLNWMKWLWHQHPKGLLKFISFQFTKNFAHLASSFMWLRLGWMRSEGLLEWEVKSCSLLASKTLHLPLASSSPTAAQGQQKNNYLFCHLQVLYSYLYSFWGYFSSFSSTVFVFYFCVCFSLRLSGLLLYDHDNVPFLRPGGEWAAIKAEDRQLVLNQPLTLNLIKG